MRIGKIIIKIVYIFIPIIYLTFNFLLSSEIIRFEESDNPYLVNFVGNGILWFLLFYMFLVIIFVIVYSRYLSSRNAETLSLEYDLIKPLKTFYLVITFISYFVVFTTSTFDYPHGYDNFIFAVTFVSIVSWSSLNYYYGRKLFHNEYLVKIVQGYLLLSLKGLGDDRIISFQKGIALYDSFLSRTINMKLKKKTEIFSKIPFMSNVEQENIINKLLSSLNYDRYHILHPLALLIEEEPQNFLIHITIGEIIVEVFKTFILPIITIIGPVILGYFITEMIPK
ncbi:hypothetical protein NMY3_03039 [Candidatus Nitrosocosmicus oleophilus]|uniref:Uncharacterized protein n=1 Tax=Candidatus Nitrosocosmicus oleophilus TaxID=1353260 RepID=A0A654M3L4_9ARCH|nr:hypothetical protein [Candidatus Nitrosocosmicus oleophilus]ALI37226.1 hypothetical protein NMY3_03039 [Candidatus Nitrosocosmicus oleophilus]